MTLEERRQEAVEALFAGLVEETEEAVILPPVKGAAVQQRSQYPVGLEPLF